MKELDEVAKQVLNLLLSSEDPLFTEEVNKAIAQPRHVTFIRLQGLKKDKKIKGKQLKNRGSWLWWRPVVNEQANHEIREEIKRLQPELKDLRARLKNDRKSSNAVKIAKLQGEKEKLIEQQQFLENILQNNEHAYRTHLWNLVNFVSDVTKKYYSWDEIMNYKQMLEDAGIPQEFIQETFED